MNDVTQTRPKCHPAVRLSYDISKIEGTLRAFGYLEQGARSAVNSIYQNSLKNIHIRAQDHVYSASEQCGDFLVKFTITSNLFSAIIIEYNPDGDPTGIFDGVTIKVPKGGHPVVVTSSPLTRTVSFLSPNSDDKKDVVFPIEPIVAAAVFTCEPPDEENSSGNIVIYLDQHIAVSVTEFGHSSYDGEMACASDHRETELAEINAYYESLSGMEAYMIHKNWAELIKPMLFEIEPGNDPLLQETIIAEPLERGFGLTLGNALRRVLLASLHGPEYDTKISRHRNNGMLNFCVYDSPDYGCINVLICGGDSSGTLFDDADCFLTGGGMLSCGAGYVLTGGGAFSCGAGYVLTGGDTLSDGAGYVLTGGGASGAFVNGTRGCNPQQLDFAGKCGRSIALFDQLHCRDWTAPGKRSGTNRQELFPRNDNVMYIEHIDDSMYYMYTASRSTGFGQFSEMPRQTPHGS